MAERIKSEIRRIFSANLITLSLIPCLIFAAVNLSFTAIVKICLSCTTAALCELVYSSATKKRFDVTIIPLSLLSAIAIPGTISPILFVLCGIAVYALIYAFRYIRPYSGVCIPALAFSVMSLFFSSYTPADSIVAGYMPDGLFVKNLIIGNYTLGMTVCSSVLCLIATIVILSVSGKIRFSDALISAISFGYFVSLLCEGNGITSLTMISFTLFDGKIFFPLTLLSVLKGYSLPASSPIMSKVFLVAQSALTAYLICKGITYGAYYSLTVFSFFALTIEKTAYRYNLRLLLI